MLMRRVVLAAALAVGWVVLSAAPAAAHPTLLATEPAAGYAVEQPPREVAVVFDEPVTFGSAGIVLRGQARGTVRTSRPAAREGGRKVFVRPLRRLPEGWYTVRWRITAQDGDVVEGTFVFGVGAGLPTHPAAEPTTSTSGSAPRIIGGYACAAVGEGAACAPRTSAVMSTSW